MPFKVFAVSGKNKGRGSRGISVQGRDGTSITLADRKEAERVQRDLRKRLSQGNFTKSQKKTIKFKVRKV